MTGVQTCALPILLAAIGDVIERHMVDIGFLQPPGAEIEANAERKVVGLASPTGGKPRQCVRCGQPSLIRQEGCDLCTSCGYSRCG